MESFSVPLETPLETASGTITERSGWLVRARADDRCGVGEATPLPGWTESHERCQQALRAALERLDRAGTDDGALRAAIDDIESPAARHGCSLALADLRARQAGDPLYRWLGAEGTVDAVPVNATVGDCGVDETVDRVLAAVEAGFDCVKLKIGVRDPDADAARLRAVREAVGDAVELRVDVNGAWDRPTAADACAWLAEVDVSYVEQPLAAADLDGHAALRERGVEVALDESLATVGVEDVLAADAADVLVCKPMALGGIDRTLAVARRAREQDAKSVVTTTIDAAVARVGARHLGAALQPALPFGLATGDRLADDLVAASDPVHDGSVSISQTPGHGLELRDRR